MALSQKIKDAAKALLPTTPKTLDELRETVHKTAEETYRYEQLCSQRDEAVAKAGERYALDIARADKSLRGLIASLKSWCLGHRDQFEGKQSLLIDGNKLAFRLSTGALVADEKDDALIESIIGSDDDELIEIAIAVTPKLDKVAIKTALQSGGEIADRLAGFGFRIEKPEAFAFEPARVSDSATL